MAFKYEYELPDGSSGSLVSDRELSDEEVDNKIYEKMQVSQPKPVAPSTPAVGTSTQQPISTPSSTSKLSPDQELMAKKTLSAVTTGSTLKDGQFKESLLAQAVDHTPDILKNLGDKLNSGVAIIGPDMKKTIKAMVGYRSPEELDGMLSSVAERTNRLEAGGMDSDKALNTALSESKLKKNSQDLAQTLVATAQTFSPMNKFKGGYAAVKAIGATAAQMGTAQGMADFVQQLTNGESVEDAAKHGYSVGSNVAVGTMLLGGALRGVAGGGKWSAEKIKGVLASPTATYMQKKMAQAYLDKAGRVVEYIQGRKEKLGLKQSTSSKELGKLTETREVLEGRAERPDIKQLSTLDTLANRASSIVSDVSVKLMDKTKELSDRGHKAMGLIYDEIFSDPKLTNLPEVDISDIAKEFVGIKLPGGSEGSNFFRTVLKDAVTSKKKTVTEATRQTKDGEVTLTTDKTSTTTPTGTGYTYSKYKTTATEKNVEIETGSKSVENLLKRTKGDITAMTPKDIHFLISSIRGYISRNPKDVNNAELISSMYKASGMLADKMNDSLQKAGLDTKYAGATQKFKDLIGFEEGSATYQNAVLQGKQRLNVGSVEDPLNTAFKNIEGKKFGESFGVDDIKETIQEGYGNIFSMGKLASDLGLEDEATQIGELTENVIQYSLTKYKLLQQKANPAIDIKDYLEDYYKKTSADVTNTVAAQNKVKQVIDETQTNIDKLNQRKINIRSSKQYRGSEKIVDKYNADRSDYGVVSGAVMLGAFGATAGGLAALPFIPVSEGFKTSLRVTMGVANAFLLYVAAKKHGAQAASLATDGMNILSSASQDLIESYSKLDMSKAPKKSVTALRNLMEVQFPKMYAHFKNEVGPGDTEAQPTEEVDDIYKPYTIDADIQEEFLNENGSQ